MHGAAGVGAPFHWPSGPRRCGAQKSRACAVSASPLVPSVWCDRRDGDGGALQNPIAKVGDPPEPGPPTANRVGTSYGYTLRRPRGFASGSANWSPRSHMKATPSRPTYYTESRFRNQSCGRGHQWTTRAVVVAGDCPRRCRSDGSSGSVPRRPAGAPRPATGNLAQTSTWPIVRGAAGNV